MMKNLKTFFANNFVISYIGGLFYASAFPIFEDLYFVPGTLFGLFLFYCALQSECHRPASIGPKKRPSKGLIRCISLSALFSLGYYTLGFYWIPETLREFGNIARPFNYVLGPFFGLFIIPQYILFAIFNHLIIKQQSIISRRFSIFFTDQTLKNILLALFLTLLEYWTPQQFPAHLGHPALAFAPFLGLAPLFGAPIFSFMGYWSLFSVYNVLIEKMAIKENRYFLSCLLLFGLFNISFPLQKEGPKEHEQSHRVRLVQGNIGNPLKLSSELGRHNAINKVYQTYEQLSLMPSEFPLDLIIWPETAYPNLLNTKNLKKRPTLIPGLFQRVMATQKAELFIGGYNQRFRSSHSYFEHEYNSALLFSTQDCLECEQIHYLKDSYNKMKLIPFGETLPFGPFNKFLSNYITNVSYFARGESFTLFKTRKGTPFISAICYEILYFDFIRNYLNHVKTAPSFLINLTNDSWYGDTSEPHQHLALSKWRALEFNLPFIRATNTGISSIIYPDGSESPRLKVFQQGKLDIDFKTYPSSPTPFQQWGIYGLIVLVIILILPLLFYRYLRERPSRIKS